VNIGDLVHDSPLGMNGVIIDVAYEDAANVDVEHRSAHGLRRWTVLYEDGEVHDAYDGELEVINDNR
jgi:hypothetical protein